MLVVARLHFHVWHCMFAFHVKREAQTGTDQHKVINRN